VKNIMRRYGWYFKSKDEFDQLYFQLKLISCPFCMRRGCLILHGHLPPAYRERGTEKTSRGRRIFCSNRKRRSGCGHTFSVVASNILKRYIIGTTSLWHFLMLIARRMNIPAALSQLKLPFSLSWGYAIRRRFLQYQTRLRTRLYLLMPEPPTPAATAPFRQTLAHLARCFPAPETDPIAAFQAHFQKPFLQ
jgi:hypothetical protein